MTSDYYDHAARIKACKTLEELGKWGARYGIEMKRLEQTNKAAFISLRSCHQFHKYHLQKEQKRVDLQGSLNM